MTLFYRVCRSPPHRRSLVHFMQSRYADDDETCTHIAHVASTSSQFSCPLPFARPPSLPTSWLMFCFDLRIASSKLWRVKWATTSQYFGEKHSDLGQNGKIALKLAHIQLENYLLTKFNCSFCSNTQSHTQCRPFWHWNMNNFHSRAINQIAKLWVSYPKDPKLRVES